MKIRNTEDDELDDFDSEVANRNSSTHMFGAATFRKALSRWWLILIFSVLGISAAHYYVSITLDRHKAVSVLGLDFSQREIIGAELETDKSRPDLVMANTISRLLSPTTQQKVAESSEIQALERMIPPDFSLKPTYMRSEDEMEFKSASETKPKALAKFLRGSTSASVRRGTTLIDVVSKHPDPDTAMVISEVTLRIFLEQELKEKSGGAVVVFNTMKREAKEARDNLQQAQRSLQVYLSATKLNEQIQQSRAQLAGLRQRYKEKHPKMIQFNASYSDLIMRFQREIKRASSTGSEKDYWAGYIEQLSEFEVQHENVGASAHEEVDEWLAIAQNAMTARANMLDASIRQHEQVYDRLTQRMAELDVSNSDEVDLYYIAQPANMAGVESASGMDTYMTGALFGGGLGFALALLLGFMDYKVYDVKGLEEITGLTCMAAIGSDSSIHKSQSEWEPLLSRDATSMVSESIRNLRASVMLLGKQHRHKLILVTSAAPGEGKTTISSELAASFALCGERTLLIAMDMRKPRLNTYFDELKGKPGVAELLSGNAELDEVIHPTSVEGLSVMISGGKSANPSELLHETELKELFDALPERFDRIILDSAPVLPVSDSRILAKFAHSILLVVRANKTPVGAVMRANDLLKAAGKLPAGVVLNGMKSSKQKGYYGYKGYGEYGDSYGYYGEN